MYYDHTSHAGNAGDVWKHFILAEVAYRLMTTEKRLNYIESHVGHSEYSLDQTGEWLDGIGRCWDHPALIKEFSYFRILAKMNPGGLRKYPGSARLVAEISRETGSVLEADIWDINPGVEASWQSAAQFGSDKFRFHIGDGFKGVKSLINKFQPVLLLIDPPYLNRRDFAKASDLFKIAKTFNWTALWWQMKDFNAVVEPYCNLKSYSINFAEAGLSCGKWIGATMALVGDDNLQDYIYNRCQIFIKIMQLQNSCRSEPH